MSLYVDVDPMWIMSLYVDVEWMVIFLKIFLTFSIFFKGLFWVYLWYVDGELT